MTERTNSNQSLQTQICTECGEPFEGQPERGLMCNACTSINGEQSVTRDYLSNYYYFYAD